MYGSRTVFAQQPPRDEGRMKRHLRSTGLFPKAGKNHDKVLQEQLAKIQKSKELGALQARRVAEDNRIPNQIQQERLQSLLQSQRQPGLRGEMGRMRNANRMAEEVGNVAYS